MTKTLLAILISVALGLILLAGLSYTIAAAQQASTLGVIAEHLLIAIVVISYYVGDWIDARFTRYRGTTDVSGVCARTRLPGGTCVDLNGHWGKKAFQRSAPDTPPEV